VLSRQSSPNIEEPAEASAEFLAALPEDIRQELLEELEEQTQSLIGSEAWA
jgi:DNA repair protein REV1